MKPRTLILRTAGTNCDKETAHAFELAGATTEAIHINRLLAEPGLIEGFQILAFPGGFSYGDDIAAGKILANQISHHLRDVLRDFIAAGKPIIGICNGFQVLVKTDLLPGDIGGQGSSIRTGQTATLAHNDCGRFIDRWISLAPRKSRCIWTQDLPASFELPIAHGEGKFVPADESVRQALHANEQIALVYAKADGSPAGGAAPANPNGSTDDIAGVCDATGLVFGLMPHPERYVSPFQHYAWTRQTPPPEAGIGLRVFKNAVQYAKSGVGAGV
ncbi:phosphoribosylformylglycinamidine synthase I [Humisphaera borealis]|uniref:Phosphoribosylformylglycinamidine synthase I n=1 Tax=Humisphaera borealis TaxID=2807512 RepID=A0A7M2X2Q1_9BACT|nr:phosphoribosylformylglycinamidine synthase I [Humisphaera borealis]QOV91954.1 phosphoribosylformylglycinamidine synthase I [Humisphaera borealis]